MRMQRPPADPRLEQQQQQSTPPPVPPARPPPKPIPHTATEEYLAYLLGLLLVSAFILTTIGLTNRSWTVDRASNSTDAFGVREVAMQGRVHYLETMGLVWDCYTSSRSALAFSILGIFASAYTLLAVRGFISSSQGSFRSLMLLSFGSAVFYLFGIMIYGTVFPSQPFKGDLAYLQLDSNWTKWLEGPQTNAFSREEQPQWRIQAYQEGEEEERRTQFGGGGDYGEETNTIEPNWKWPPQIAEPLSSSPSFHSLSSSSSDPSSHLGVTLAQTNSGIPDFPSPVAPPSSEANTGIPDFPGIGGGGGGGDEPYPSPPGYPPPPLYDAKLAKQIKRQVSYARMLWLHLGSTWRFGSGYWLVVSASLCTVCLPVLYCFWALCAFLLERHRAAEVQEKRLIPFIVVFFFAWVTALTGVASRHWKDTENHPVYTHFGVDQMHVQGVRYGVVHYSSFGSQAQRIVSSSQAALAFGLIGIIVGFTLFPMLISAVYDRFRSPLPPFIVLTITACCWFLSLLIYGTAFPTYVFDEQVYAEFGYSYWLVLAGCIVFSLPSLSYVAYRIWQRVARTSKEERLMFIPTVLAFASLCLTIVALSLSYWVATPSWGLSRNNHLGLIRGVIAGRSTDFEGMAQLVSPALSSTGMATLVLLLCGLLIQLPVTVLGFRYVLGTHDLCRGQMPLLNTGLSIASWVLYLLGCAVYTGMMPWSKLNESAATLTAGSPSLSYELSHSWRLQVSACALTLLSTIGFGLLAEPPAPGEPSLLAAAVGDRKV